MAAGLVGHATQEAISIELISGTSVRVWWWRCVVLQAVQVIRIPLHHFPALGQIVGLVVDARNSSFYVRKLNFDIVAVKIIAS